MPEPVRSLNDDALFAEARDRGSREALAELFRRYHARVYVWCARMLGSDSEAEDAVQDIFLRILVKPMPYQERSSFGAWLYVVTRNACLNRIRKRRTQTAEADIALWEDVLVASSSPEADAGHSKLGQLIQRACREELSDVEARVVYLRYYWGLRVKEINALLKLDNPSGARTHLATGKRKLRAALAQHLGADELNLLLGKEGP